jgi:hypothetical protein
MNPKTFLQVRRHYPRLMELMASIDKLFVNKTTGLADLGAKHADIFAPLYSKNDPSTKTGSGQTQGKALTKKRDAFLAAGHGDWVCVGPDG